MNHPIGLTISEFRLIRDCLHARTLVPGGNFLPATRWFAAARRMIKRGYLTKAPGKFEPNHGDWIAVRITKKNIEKYNLDLDLAIKAAMEKKNG